jgi:hypothetical protein
MPYLVLAREKKLDARFIKDRRLRNTYDLPCLRNFGIGHIAAASNGSFMTEAMMSVAINVRDNRWWEIFCLNDEFPFDESRIEADPSDTREGEGVEEAMRQREARQHSSRSADGPSRSRSRTGLEPTPLDQFDPVLDSSGSYSHWEPRGYALNAVDNYVQYIVHSEETLFESIKKDSRAYVSSSIIRANNANH